MYVYACVCVHVYAFVFTLTLLVPGYNIGGHSSLSKTQVQISTTEKLMSDLVGWTLGLK